MIREELEAWTLFAVAAIHKLTWQQGKDGATAHVAGMIADTMLAEWRERRDDVDDVET